MTRQSRKLDHLKYALSLDDGPSQTGFQDISLVHNCLPDLSWDEISLSTSIAGITLPHPVIINAMTGGAQDVTKINSQLAQVAQLTGAAMAVGSQYAAMEKPDIIESYSVIRKHNPNGVVFANLGAHANCNEARQAIDMIDAQAIQIHLNVAQELFMAEGDRNFTGYLRNISKIVNSVNVPVIVKEVGCGIAAEQAKALAEIGIRAIDIGGTGGTNFVAIEGARRKISFASETLSWGIPTAISAVEVVEAIPKNIDLMVSGGIRTPLDVLKSLALGAKVVGIAKPIISLIQSSDTESAVDFIHTLLDDLRRFMLMAGVLNMAGVSDVPLIITGYSREWLSARGIDITKYAIRKKHG